jgi:hypothetical protein
MHGAQLLPTVEVDSRNLAIEGEERYVGDRARRVSFAAILDKWRKPLRKLGDDPFGEKPSDEISKKKLDSHLTEGDIDAAIVVHSAVEDFAQQLPNVIRRFLKSK